MSVARDNFLGRIEAIRKILSDPISTDTTPVPVPSSTAVVTRNGCMVMLYCALESFIRDRSLECAKSLDQTVIPYTHLPEGLKYASIVSTFEGLLHQTRNFPDTEKIVEFETAAIAAASGKLGSPYQFTEYSFARDKSNVSVEEIGWIAKSFGVDKFWPSTRSICAIAGMAIAENVEQIYRQLATERHKAAHVASHNVSHADVTSAVPKATAIALAFDVLISTATQSLCASSVVKGAVPPKISDTNVKFITVRLQRTDRWAAYRPDQARAAFVEADQLTAIARASQLAKAKGQSVLCLDSSGRASVWRTLIG